MNGKIPTGRYPPLLLALVPQVKLSVPNDSNNRRALARPGWLRC